MNQLLICTFGFTELHEYSIDAVDPKRVVTDHSHYTPPSGTESIIIIKMTPKCSVHFLLLRAIVIFTLDRPELRLCGCFTRFRLHCSFSDNNYLDFTLSF